MPFSSSLYCEGIHNLAPGPKREIEGDVILWTLPSSLQSARVEIRENVANCQLLLWTNILWSEEKESAEVWEIDKCQKLQNLPQQPSVLQRAPPPEIGNTFSEVSPLIMREMQWNGIWTASALRVTRKKQQSTAETNGNLDPRICSPGNQKTQDWQFLIAVYFQKHQST